MKYVLGRREMMLTLHSLVLFVASLSALSAVAEEQVQKYGSSVYHYEGTSVEIVSTDANGAGELRIYNGDCANCYDTGFFNSDVVLETPLGAYRGLEKLSTWSDRALLVSVVTSTQEVVGIFVENYPYVAAEEYADEE